MLRNSLDWLQFPAGCSSLRLTFAGASWLLVHRWWRRAVGVGCVGWAKSAKTNKDVGKPPGLPRSSHWTWQANQSAFAQFESPV